MTVKLHRCSNLWAKFGPHPCWKVQKALDEEGIEYKLVRLPWQRGQRDEVKKLSGQRKYPVIEFEDGSIYREKSEQMAATIKSGRLMEKRPAPGPPA